MPFAPSIRPLAALFFLILLGLQLNAALPMLIPYEVEGKWGYCNARKEVVIRAAFDAARPFQDGIGVIQRGNGLGAIRQDGSMVVPAAFDEILPGLGLRLRRGGKYALASRSGKLLTAFEFDEITPRIAGLYEVRKGELVGIIDTTGALIVPPRFDDIRCLRDARGLNTWLIQVRQDDKYGIYNYCGDELQKPHYDLVNAFRNGYAIVRCGNKFGMLNQEGREVSACVYDNLLDMREERAAAMINGHWGFIDPEGREVIPFKYEAVNERGFLQGRVPVLQQGVWKFVDRFGRPEMTVSGSYSFVGNISEGLMSACILADRGLRYGYLTPEGTVQIPFKYDFAEPFQEGLAIVGMRRNESAARAGMRYGVLDRNGREILPVLVESLSEAELHIDSLRHFGWTWLSTASGRCRYDVNGHKRDCGKYGWEKLLFKFNQTRCEQHSLVAVSQNGLWGYANADAELVIPCKYRMAECFSEGLAKVWPNDGGNYFFIDAMGNEYAGR